MDGGWRMVRLEVDGGVVVVLVVVVLVGCEGCGLPSLLRRATLMTVVKGCQGPNPTRLPDCARSWCTAGAKVVRSSLRIEMPDVTGPQIRESGLSVACLPGPMLVQDDESAMCR